MSSKHDQSRRIFLAHMATQLGLFSAAGLFQSKVFAQATTPKKNVIFVFFNHGANIPFGDKERLFHQGGFHFGNGSNIANMSSIAGESLFVRGVNNIFTNNEGHNPNQYAAFTGARFNQGDTSLDIVAGRELMRMHGAKVSNLNLAFNMHQGDKRDHGPKEAIWRTTSFSKGDPVFPEISVDSTFKRMIAATNCTPGSNPTDPAEIQRLIGSIERENRKLNFVQENLKHFRSAYLMPKGEMEKVESQVATKIDTNQDTLQKISSGEGPGVDQSCENLSNPKDSYAFNDAIRPDRDQGIRLESPQNFNNKSLAFFDVMVSALKLNYTRSILYHTNIWNQDHHGVGGHDPINNPVMVGYLSELSRTLNGLFVKLKAAGIYEETMIVVTGEFAQQNKLNSKSPDHRGDNIPWLIVNSGKTGEVNLSRPIHPGDVHCNILNRLGIPTNTFGTVQTQLNRVGDFSNKFLV